MEASDDGWKTWSSTLRRPQEIGILLSIYVNGFTVCCYNVESQDVLTSPSPVLQNLLVICNLIANRNNTHSTIPAHAAL